MKYEYNGNLTEDERIDLVAKEIVDTYPDVSYENAKKIAVLEGKISSKKTAYDELKRLYNIMLVNSDNKKIVVSVYPDYLYKINELPIDKNSKYIAIAEEIFSYLNNTSAFPFINDYQ